MHIEIQNCFSFWLRPPDPLPGLRPWTTLGEFCPPDPLHRTSPHILYQVYAPAEYWLLKLVILFLQVSTVYHVSQKMSDFF